MNIAFWSNVAGRSATSGNMLAVSTMASVLYSLKTVLVQTDRMSKPIDEVFEGRKTDNMVNEEFHFYNRKGMDELKERCRLNLLSREMIETNMVNVRHTNIFYIPSAKEECNDESHEVIKIYEVIMNQLKSMGELNFWDISNGYSPESQAIMSKCDVAVINLSQEPQHYRTLKKPESIMEKAVFLVGKYDSGSRKNIGSICKEYGIPKENTGVIPYNIHFHDAINNGRIVPFIMKNIFSKKQDVNFEFINSVFKATNLVLKKAGVEGIGE